MFTRVQTPEQIETVACLARAIWPDHYAPINGIEHVDYMLEKFQSVPAVTRQINKESFQYYLIEPDGEPVGYLAVQPRDEDLFLSKLYLLSTARGRGLGRAAIELAAAISREFKKPYITLTVNRNNSDTIAVYKKCGFIIYEEKVADIGNGYVMDDYILRLNTPVES